MRSVRPAFLAALLIIGTSSSARADITAFLSVSTAPANRPAVGGALGIGLVIVGLEFEYSSTAEDTPTGAPSIKVGSANGYLQTPVALFGIQPYVTAGGGVYRERLGNATQTSFGSNVGGGARIALVGPLRLRLDYRVFNLGSDARYSPSHRFYAGLNLKF